jgi:hypothetical protein
VVTRNLQCLAQAFDGGFGSSTCSNRQSACGAIIVGPCEDRKQVRYLGIEIDDAIEIAEKIEV